MRHVEKMSAPNPMEWSFELRRTASTHPQYNRCLFDFCLTVVRRDGRQLRRVPESLRTPDLCLAALQQTPHALQFVPMHAQTADLCWMAVKRDGTALRHVPKRLRTAELCRAGRATKWGRVAVRSVPPAKRSLGGGCGASKPTTSIKLDLAVATFSQHFGGVDARMSVHGSFPRLFGEPCANAGLLRASLRRALRRV